MRPKEHAFVRTVVTWLSGLSLMWTSGVAQAGDTSGGHWSLSNNVLSLEGEILPRDLRQFHRLFSSSLLTVPYPKPVRIEVDSPGGDLGSALRIVRIIKSAQRQKTTVAISVRSGKRCYSTCLLILAAGDNRVAAPDALLRFPTTGDTEWALRILSGIAEVDPDLANYLLKAQYRDEAQLASQLGRVYREFVTLQD